MMKATTKKAKTTTGRTKTVRVVAGTSTHPPIRVDELQRIEERLRANRAFEEIARQRREEEKRKREPELQKDMDLQLEQMIEKGLYNPGPEDLERAKDRRANDRLKRIVSDEVKKAVERIARGVKNEAREGAIEGLKKSLPREYAKIVNMSADELDAEVKTKKRKPGGGRKKAKDLDDKQVKAVLDAMKKKRLTSRLAYSSFVIRNMRDGDYQNPYRDSKGLDAAVGRYCRRKGINLPATKKGGKWSITK